MCFFQTKIMLFTQLLITQKCNKVVLLKSLIRISIDNEKKNNING